MCWHEGFNGVFISILHSEAAQLPLNRNGKKIQTLYAILWSLIQMEIRKIRGIAKVLSFTYWPWPSKDMQVIRIMPRQRPLLRLHETSDLSWWKIWPQWLQRIRIVASIPWEPLDLQSFQANDTNASQTKTHSLLVLVLTSTNIFPKLLLRFSSCLSLSKSPCFTANSQWFPITPKQMTPAENEFE